MRGLKQVVIGLALAAIPGSAFAQATLAGVVKDSSGAVLPGVTVEAASDVLIEKARSALTDGNGRYQIPDLRPGTYTVMFTLTGFATIKRENISLTGTLTTTADADMRVGSVSETVTVSGETPIVDIQSSTRQRVLNQEIITAVPTSRNSFSLGVLIPGVSLFSGGVGGNNLYQDVGGALGPTTLALTAHGSKTEDQRLLVNGVSLSTMIGGGWGGGAIPNATGISEMAFDTAAVSAELATGGVRINFIPRDGGNRFSGTVAGSFANESLQGSSTRTVRSFDPVRASTVKQNGEINPGFGGPIKKDTLWFFLSGRYQKADLYVPGIFHDKNANNPNAFTYIPDPGRPAIAPREWQVYQGRLTWQAAQRHKIGVTYDLESNCFCPTNVGPGIFGGSSAPEAGNDQRFPLQRFVQVDWSMPVSSRLLIEASGIHRVERWGAYHLQTGGDALAPTDPRVIGVNEQTTNFNYRAAPGGFGPPFNESWNINLHYRAAVSYITGSHAVKVGFNNAWGHHENTPYAINPYSYIFSNGLPAQIREFATPYTSQVDVDADLGIYAQDKWTAGRWTAAGGVRFDYFKNSFPEQSIGPGPLVPNRPTVTFPRTPNLNWKDVTPKLGLTYDVFGNGRTALKTSLNKYLTGYGTFSFGNNGASSAPNPINALVNTTTRPWIDANGDFTPQCDLTNPLPNGECLGLQNPNFGKVVPGTVYDPNLLNGWGKRQYNWEFSVGVQHELRPRVSVEVSYFRRWYGNFQVTDNKAYSKSDFDVLTITAPSDPDLPGGGGYSVPGVYNLNPLVALSSRPDQFFVTLAEPYGKQTEHWNGVDVIANARLRNSFIVQGGLSTGRTDTDNCELVNNPQLAELNAAPAGFPPIWLFTATPQGYCHTKQAFLTQVKGLAAYTIPHLDVQISGTFQSLPGPVLLANYNAIGPGLGFLPIPGLNFKSVQLIHPGDVYGERINQLDFRISKLLRYGRSRSSINLDIYNLGNSNAVTVENSQFAAWRQPQGVLQARFFKISAQFDF